MRAGIFAVFSMVCASAATAAVAAPPMHIEFAEAVSLPAAAGKAEFDAYGRRFSLKLESNDRLLRAMPVANKSNLGNARVLRGKIDGVAGSWVRLTRVGKGLQGAIWDGNDLYVVAAYGSIARQLTTPLQASPDQTVVYRLSDTRGSLPPEFCGLADDAVSVDSGKGSALLQYKSLVSALRFNAATVEDSLDISLIADRAFQDLIGVDAAAEMLARLNIVDGIFAEQVGVLLVPTEFRMVPANADPFTATDASQLLTQVATFRENTPAVRAAGLAHLMTGKNLDSNTLGIAFLDSLCDAREGVSLSDSELGTFWSALVMAHEVGHNFGARHDGVAGVCLATEQTWLMAPEINGSAQFSACSLNSIAASIAGARGVCVGPASYADVALVLPASPYAAQTNGTFSLPITARSLGNLPATGVQLQVTFPPYFSLSGGTLEGATCTVVDRTITCALGDLAAGEDRALDLRITGISVGSFPVQAALTTTANELLTGNNSGQIQVGVQSGVDLGVSISASASTVFVTDPIDYTVDVTSHGALATHGGTVWINIGGVPIESFNAGANACAVDQFSNWILFCQLADVAPGATSRITVRGRPTEGRTAYAAVNVNLPNDANGINDSASTSVVVYAEREVRTSVSTEELRAVVGATYEVTYTLTTFGRLPAQNVRFSVQVPWMGEVESVTIPSVACVPSAEFVDCDLGTLAPGDVRTAVVRFHMTSPITSSISASTRWSGGPFNEYSGAYTWVYANLTVDVAVSAGGSFVLEDQTGEGGFNVETKGVDPAQGIIATIELTPPLRFLSLAYFSGPSGWTCTLLTEQRGRCTGSFAGGDSFPDRFAGVRYTFVSPTAGDGLATITVSAIDDGDPTNNVVQAPMQVRPYIDVAISAPNPARLLVAGQTTTVDAIITTGKNPVPGAQLTPWASNASLALDSITVAGADCSQTTSGSACPLGTLPANASIAVQAVFRAVTGEGSPYAVLDVGANNDSAPGNNHLAIPVYTLSMTDISVSLAQGSVTGTNGAALNLPRITIQNGTGTSRDVSVDIPLPAFASVTSVQAFDGICTGTATLRCYFAGIPPNNPRTIDIALSTTATGTFTSSVVLTAVNDSTADNNTATLAITVNAPPAGGGSSSSGGGGGSSGGGNSSSGGGGGGGRIEWLALALLAGLVMRRSRSAATGSRSARVPRADSAALRR